jgi:hypothetical protein
VGADVRGVGAANGNGSATVNVTTTVTPNLPTVLNGDRVYIYAVSTGAISTPASWTALLASTALGGGTAADTTGTRQVSVFYRDYDGVWTMPLLTVAAVAATGPGVEVATIAYSKGPNDRWLTPTIGSGSDTTSGTGYSVTTGSFSDQVGVITMFWAWPLSPGTLSALTFSATGLTVGSFTNRHGVNGNTTGFDCFLADWTASVTVGATVAHIMGITGTVAGTVGGVLVNQTVLSAPELDGSMKAARRRASTW